MSLLWTLTFPISVLVCLAFWTLINPVWDQKMRPGFVLLTEHFVNMWIFIFEFLINRNTFYLKHGVIIYAYALLYSLWSVIHFLAKVGVSPDMACHDYPLDECPIYPVLDWHHPARTESSDVGQRLEFLQPDFRYKLRDALDGSEGDMVKQAHARRNVCLAVEIPLLAKFGYDASEEAVHQHSLAMAPLLRDCPDIVEKNQKLVRLVNPTMDVYEDDHITGD
eukprot:g8949.t1